MPSLRELLEQKAAIERAIESRRNLERDEAIEQIIQLMFTYSITVADLMPEREARKTRASVLSWPLGEASPARSSGSHPVPYSEPSKS